MSRNSESSTTGNDRVAAIFSAYDELTRKHLMTMRSLIFEAAASTAGVGEVEETLKWGQPSYITRKPKSGSTIRIDKSSDASVSAYFICSTNLVDTFRTIYPDVFEFIGNRELRLTLDTPLPETELKHCFQLALSYHLKPSGPATL